MRKEKGALHFSFNQNGEINRWSAVLDGEHPTIKRRLLEKAFMFPGGNIVTLSYPDSPDVVIEPEDLKAAKLFRPLLDGLHRRVDHATGIDVAKYPQLFYTFVDLEPLTALSIVKRVERVPYVDIITFSPLPDNSIAKATWSPSRHMQSGMDQKTIIEAMSGAMKLTVLKES